MYTTKHNEKKHFSYYYLNNFSRQGILDNHSPDFCSFNNVQKVTLPEEGKNLFLTFRHYDKQLLQS